MALKFPIVGLALMFSGATFSAVTVTAPEKIKVVAVNGQEVSNGFLIKNNQYKIDAGENTINVRYTEFFQHADNSHDILKSSMVSVKTPVLKDGETYHLQLIQAPKDFDEAEKYKDQPIIGLYDQKNKLLVQQSGVKTDQKNWFTETLFNGADSDLTKNKVTASAGQPSAIYTSEVNTSSEQQLIQLWKNSSQQERQKFMSWLATQAH